MAVEERNAEKKNNSLRTKYLGAGMATIAVIVIVVLFLFFKNNDSHPQQDEPQIGVLDMQTLIRSHRDYGKLQTMMREAASLSAQVSLDNFEFTMKQMDAEKKLFDDEARQKTNLEMITRHSQKMEELQARSDEIYKRMKPLFDQERDAIDKEYGNRILNLQLKADNAIVLELSDDQKKAIEAEWKQLKEERNQKQNELLEAQQARFEQQVEAEIGEERRRMIAERDTIRNQSQMEAIQHMTQVQDRNTQAVNDALQPIQQKMNMAKKRAALEIKLTEIKLLRQKIFDDISGRAAKLAIIHHLSLIIADPVDNIRGMEYDSLGIGDWRELRSPVIGINTMDLTDEMLQEMKNIQ
ncbi:MAG: hypothetical protein K6C05_05030 [Anaerovibrio sp.]|uniref:hypothetical protein n=1 Tax=Anaerovibrio sp. TaxID=1872532 RepID=UPI0025D1691A|nr:hypothetical protein [Anaerovibrio sp.]MCR5176194.1 hypothetical protein [Anaerovibrio sp.]